MKKALFIFAGLILLVDLIDSFLANETVGSIFGYELNIWIYRGFKLLLFLLIANAYYMLLKRKSKTKNEKN
jgi:uncharacterized membrane protein YfcA